MSRIGKIARLPKAVRDELNRRLEDGEEGKGLVAWLNGLAEVQEVLQADFDGRPINEPNLTAWRQGGYEDWRRQEEALEAAGRLVAETSELDRLAQGHGLADRAAMMAALALGEQLMATRRMEDGAEKRRAVLKLVRGLVRLRQTDREQERAQRDAAQAARSAEIHEAWAERAGRRAEEESADSEQGGRTSNMERRTSNVEHGTTSGGRKTYAGGRRPRSIEEMSDAQIRSALVRLGRGRAGDGGRRAENGEQGTDDGELRTEDGRQGTEGT